MINKKKNRTNHIIIFTMLFCTFVESCKNEKVENNDPKKYSSTINSLNTKTDTSSKVNIDGSSINLSEEPDPEKDDCGVEDGNYTAKVIYNNPEDGSKKEYSLKVEVKNCTLMKIIFPKSGPLKQDVIKPDDIDEDGDVSVEGLDGKTTYDVHLEQE